MKNSIKLNREKYKKLLQEFEGLIDEDFHKKDELNDN